MANLVPVREDVAAIGRGFINVVHVGEAVTQGEVGYYDRSTHLYRLAQASTQAKANARGIFITPAAARGHAVIVGTHGTISLGITLTVGEEYYVSATSGKICPRADLKPGEFITRLGIASSETQLDIDIDASDVQEPVPTFTQYDSFADWWDFTNASSLWQNTAGTTAVANVDDPIQKVDGHSDGSLGELILADGGGPLWKGSSGGALFTDDRFALTFSSAISQGYTVVVICKVSGNSQGIVDGIGVSNRCAMYVAGGGNYTQYASTSHTHDKTRVDTDSIVTGYFNGATSYMRVDGRQDIGDAGATTLTGISVGGFYNSATYLSNSVVKHVVIFDDRLTSSQLAYVENYFADEANGAGYTNKFPEGGDNANTCAFDPVGRKFWRFGADNEDKDLIQWWDVDKNIGGSIEASIPNSGGYAVYHPTKKRIYIYGGRLAAAGNGVTDIYEFDPATDTLTLLTETLSIGLYSLVAGYYSGDDKIYIFGGLNGTTRQTLISVHDPTAATVTDTTADLPVANAAMGIAWAEDVGRFYLLGGYNGTGTSSPDNIVTYNPATPATNAVDTGQTLSIGAENHTAAYVDGAIYAFNGYDYATTYLNLITKIVTATNTVSTLSETGHRIDDDAVAFYDSVDDKIYVGPFLHSTQAVDNTGPDKRIIWVFDPNTETLEPEVSLEGT